MQRFRNILAVVDDLDSFPRIAEAAARLAARNEARLTFSAVVETTGAGDRVKLADGSDVDVAALVAKERLAELQQAVEGLGIRNADVDVISGVGFVEVIKRILRDRFDMVFCGPGEQESRRLARSSLVMHLLRKSPVPVWVETEQGDDSLDVAVALGPFIPSAQQLNELLIQLAGSLTASRGGALHLIHAWRLEGESLFRRGRARQPAAYVDNLVEAARIEASANLSYFHEKALSHGIPCEIHLRKGVATDVLGRAIEEIRPGVVVLGTVARTGLPGMFIGNTAESVLGTIESSVLAVKPEGFVSPISVE